MYTMAVLIVSWDLTMLVKGATDSADRRAKTRALIDLHDLLQNCTLPITLMNYEP